MDHLPMALIASRAALERSARSALPDAPVIPDPPAREWPRVTRSRLTLARLLQRAARAVEPSPTCRPVS